MKINTIKKFDEGNNRGFTATGRVLDIVKHDGRDGLLIEKLSGANPGGQMIVLQKIDPDYKGHAFDKEGLESLKIKKKSIIGITEARALGKAVEGEPLVVETRRATKLGKDYRPDQTLVMSSYGSSIGRLSGHIITPKAGVHADVTENPMAKLKAMALEAVDKLSDNQGLMLVFNEKSEKGSTTIHRALSRFQKEENKPAELISLDAFKAKVEDFFANPKATMTNFEGTVSAEVVLGSVFDEGSTVSAAVVPSERISLTGSKYLDNDKRTVTTGIGGMGIAIDPSNDERDYPIIQIGAMEVVGLVGARRKGPNSEPAGGPKVVQQKDDYLFRKLTNQIDMLNGVEVKHTQRSEAVAAPKETAPAAEEDPSASDYSDFSQDESDDQNDNYDDINPFG